MPVQSDILQGFNFVNAAKITREEIKKQQKQHTIQCVIIH